MIAFEHQGVTFSGSDVGVGQPVVFQHGLGGDRQQTAESLPETLRLRRLTLECRGHGLSELGDPSQLSIAQFAEDVLAFVEARRVNRFMAGGISMGAAIALRLAILHPERVSALALVRPAWVTEAAPPQMRPFYEVARYLRMADPAQGWAEFLKTSTAQDLQVHGPDNLASLKGFFGSPRQLDHAELGERIAFGGPGVTREQLANLQIPVLVVGNELDAVHPLTYAEELAGLMPLAQLVVVPAKARDKAAYLEALHTVLGDFFHRQSAEDSQPKER